MIFNPVSLYVVLLRLFCYLHWFCSICWCHSCWGPSISSKYRPSICHILWPCSSWQVNKKRLSNPMVIWVSCSKSAWVTHIWTLRPKIDPQSCAADSPEAPLEQLSSLLFSSHSSFTSPQRSSQPVEGLHRLTSWSQTHLLPASYPNLKHSIYARESYVISCPWFEKKGPLAGNRKCSIVKARCVY